MNVRPGDVVARRKGLVMHKGVVLRDGRVLHNCPTHGEHASSLSEFARGRRVYAESIDEAQRAAILRRAHARLDASNDYHLFRNNCDHTVTSITDGRAHSPQLTAWLLGAAVGATTLLLTRHPGVAGAAAALASRWGRQLSKL